MTAQQIAGLLSSFRFRFSEEKDLQEGIEKALAGAGIPFEREVHLDAGDIVDFMVGGVAVEVKIDGSLSALTRQVARYARHERVAEILVVSSRNRLVNLPASIGAKPLHTLSLAGGML